MQVNNLREKVRWQYKHEMVGTARCAVRAAFSGATILVGHATAQVPRALRAVTAQRAVPTIVSLA